jgi:hypothetical protein
MAPKKKKYTACGKLRGVSTRTVAKLSAHFQSNPEELQNYSSYSGERKKESTIHNKLWTEWGVQVFELELAAGGTKTKQKTKTTRKHKTNKKYETTKTHRWNSRLAAAELKQACEVALREQCDFSRCAVVGSEEESKQADLFDSVQRRVHTWKRSAS